MEFVYQSLLFLFILIASFFLSFVFIRVFKGQMLKWNLFGYDINKANKPKVPEAGGMLLLPGIWIMVIGLVESHIINPIAYVFLFIITCFAAIGFFDDGFKIFKRETGWGRYVINRGVILFLFTLVFGYYILPSILLVCPCTLYWYAVGAGLLILAVSSLTNSFAGLNGWEVGSSTIIVAGLTVMAVFSEVYTSTLISLCLIILGSAIGLLWFNRYPARIFPGDSGTLMLGSFIGCIIIFIDRWYLAVGLFAPHIYDIILKLRTNPHDISQKKDLPYVLKDGKIQVPKSGKLDFAKLVIRYLGPMGERRLVSKIHLIVIQNTLFWTLLYILLRILET